MKRRLLSILVVLGLMAPLMIVNAAPAAAQGMTVAQMQQHLKDHKCKPGPVDGIWGPQTELAMKRYQFANYEKIFGYQGGDPVDGIASPGGQTQALMLGQNGSDRRCRAWDAGSGNVNGVPGVSDNEYKIVLDQSKNWMWIILGTGGGNYDKLVGWGVVGNWKNSGNPNGIIPVGDYRMCGPGDSGSPIPPTGSQGPSDDADGGRGTAWHSVTFNGVWHLRDFRNWCNSSGGNVIDDGHTNIGFHQIPDDANTGARMHPQSSLGTSIAGESSGCTRVQESVANMYEEAFRYWGVEIYVRA